MTQGLSKLARAALTVNPLARTMTAKKLAQTRVRLEAILKEGSEATDAQKATARKKLAQMDKVEAQENASRSARASKNAPESAAKKEKLAPAPLKSLEGRPVELNRGGAPKKKKVPVISIGVGMAELKKGKTKMMRGGMANKKEHMYVAGGAVMDNLTPAQKNMVKKMAAANK